MRTLTRILALLALMAASLVVTATAPAQADPIEDCDWVPLRYSARYTTDGERWRVDTRLRVYDLCDDDGDGTITGWTSIGTRNGTDFRDIRPYRPTLDYRLQNRRSYTDNYVDLDRWSRDDDWHPWRVSTDEDVPLDGRYFRVIRIKWSVTVDDEQYRRTIICERVEEDGRDAYECE